MVKFKTKDLIGLGLSEENIRLLKEGKPISIYLNEMGIDKRLMIFYGVTENHMENMLNEYIGPKTTINKPKQGETL